MKMAWLLAGLLICGFTAPLVAEPISADQVRVLDGNTVRLHNKRPDVRLVGFNLLKLDGRFAMQSGS